MHTCTCALPSKARKTEIDFFQMLLLFLAELSQSRLDFFHIVDLQLIFTLLYDSINLAINRVQLWAVVGHSSGERKSRISHCNSCFLLRASCASALSCLMSPTMCLIAANVCWDNVAYRIIEFLRHRPNPNTYWVIHEPILIVFWQTCYWESKQSKRCFIFALHLISVICITWG